MISVDSTRSDEEPCGVKDDTKNYGKHEKGNNPRMLSMLTKPEEAYSWSRPTHGDINGGTALTI